MTSKTPKVPLARLSALVLRTLVDDMHERLAQRGFRDVGSNFGYVLLELRSRALGVNDVARLLGVTKQAASKVLTSMLESGYLRPAATDDQRARMDASKWSNPYSATKNTWGRNTKAPMPETTVRFDCRSSEARRIARACS